MSCLEPMGETGASANCGNGECDLGRMQVNSFQGIATGVPEMPLSAIGGTDSRNGVSGRSLLAGRGLFPEAVSQSYFIAGCLQRCSAMMQHADGVVEVFPGCPPQLSALRLAQGAELFGADWFFGSCSASIWPRDRT